MPKKRGKQTLASLGSRCFRPLCHDILNEAVALRKLRHKLPERLEEL